MKPTRIRIAPAAGLAVLVAAFWMLRLARGTDYALANTDLYTYFLPLYEATYARIAQGDIPLWNPYQLCGIPWLATLQTGFFYPTHALYLILPVPLALAGSTVLHLLLAFFGTVLFARWAGFGAAAAALAAMLFVLRGHVPHLLLWPNQLEAVAWLPIGCLAVLALVRKPQIEWMLVLACVMGASWFAGYPQPTVYSHYAWATLLILLLLGHRAEPRRWFTASGLFVGAAFLGAGLASVQLLPAAELALLGTRDTRELTANVMFPLGGPIIGNPGLSIFRREGITGSQHSIGVLALSLVPVAVLAREYRALVAWAFLFGVVSLLYVFGPLTSVFDMLIKLPLLASFRAPSRAVFLTDFCVAMLAAAGLEALLAGPRACRVGRGAAVLALGALTAVLGLVVAGWWSAGDRRWPLLVGAGLLVLLIVSLVRPVDRRALAIGVLVLAGLEVFLAPPQRLRLPYAPDATSIYRTHAETYAEVARLAGGARAWVIDASGAPAIAKKVATLSGLRSVDDYEPVNLRRQAEYFTYLTDGTATLTGPPWVFGGAIRAVAVPGRLPLSSRRRLLDLAGVRYVVMPRGLFHRADVRAMTDTAGFRLRSAADADLLVFENPHAFPRAFVVYRATPAPPPDTLLARLADEAFDPMLESYVEGPGISSAADGPLRGVPATIVRDDEEVVEVDATLAADGLLVLADSFYPGWRATVDGISAPIVAANHLFRAVPVPAGAHRVRFEYRPMTFTAGAALSLAASGAVIVLLFVARRSRGALPRA
jgi:hypothetical protein